MHTVHILPGVAIQPNLELKIRPKQLLGSLPLVIILRLMLSFIIKCFEKILNYQMYDFGYTDESVESVIKILSCFSIPMENKKRNNILKVFYS